MVTLVTKGTTRKFKLGLTAKMWGLEIALKMLGEKKDDIFKKGIRPKRYGTSEKGFRDNSGGKYKSGASVYGTMARGNKMRWDWTDYLLGFLVFILIAFLLFIFGCIIVGALDNKVCKVYSEEKIRQGFIMSGKVMVPTTYKSRDCLVWEEEK